MPNITQDPIISRDRIIYSPLHIKLGLIKSFVKALDTESECFQQIITSILGWSYEKIKAGVFDGLQIQIVIRDDHFVAKMTTLETAACLSFVTVLQNSLGKSKNYYELVNKMLSALRAFRCKPSIRLHFLSSHLDQFPENLRERFHQDSKIMEKRYQSR